MTKMYCQNKPPSLASELLIYLYYSLDNRPWYFRVMLKGVTQLRHTLVKIRSLALREIITWILALGVYLPLIALGWIVSPFGLGDKVPLFEGYRGEGIMRIRQNAYDRFFTRIEQRVSRAEIMTLQDIFSEVKVSDGISYWHFLCRR